MNKEGFIPSFLLLEISINLKYNNMRSQSLHIEADKPTIVLQNSSYYFDKIRVKNLPVIGKRIEYAVRTYYGDNYVIKPCCSPPVPRVREDFIVDDF